MALGAEWTFVNPLADASTADQVGGNLELSVAAGATHDLWTTNKDAIYAYQAAANTDMEIQIKFVGDFTVVSGQSKLMGLIFLDTDTQNCVRFDIFSNKTGTPIKTHNFAATIVSGTATSQHLSDLTTIVNRDFYLRVNRTGDAWTFYTMDTAVGALPFGGWVQRAQFNHTITINRVAIFAGTGGDASAPAFLAKFDYFLVDQPANGIACNGVVTEAEDDVVSGDGTILVTATGVVRESFDVLDYALGNIITIALSEFPKFKPRIRETTTSIGVGPFTLSGAFSASFNTVASGYAAGEPFYCVIVARDTGLGWQEGLAHINEDGTITFDSISYSSNSNEFVNFAAGTKEIFIDVTAGFVNDLVDKINEISNRLLAAGI